MPIYKMLQDKLQLKEAEDILQSVSEVKKGPRSKKSKGDQPPDTSTPIIKEGTKFQSKKTSK